MSHSKRKEFRRTVLNKRPAVRAQLRAVRTNRRTTASWSVVRTLSALVAVAALLPSFAYAQACPGGALDAVNVLADIAPRIKGHACRTRCADVKALQAHEESSYSIEMERPCWNRCRTRFGVERVSRAPSGPSMHASCASILQNNDELFRGADEA